VRRVDLHTHSNASDGGCSPAEVVRFAHGRKAELFALTDHDSVGGVLEAAAEAARLGLRFLPAVEVNTRDADNLHILGYGIDPASPALAARLEAFRGSRLLRIGRIVEKLRALGLALEVSDVLAEAKEPGRAVGRPHVADALRRKKIVSGRKEAFHRFLAPEKPAYVEPMGPTVREAIETIRAAGGWASLAHPYMAELEDVERYIGWGLEGIEVYYPSHTRAVTERLLDWAWRFGLTPTGGSDFHGPKSERCEIATVSMPQDVYDKLMERIGK
jgi:hypothetical protein